MMSLTLESSIKDIVNECEDIEKQEDKLNDMIQQPEYIDMAEKIKKIRGTIDNMNSFLVRKKISNYKN